MSLIGKNVSEFRVEAYQNERFITVADKDLLGHWSVIVFYPADFTFVCPTELEDLQNTYEEFKKKDVKCILYPVIHTLFIRHGMMPAIVFLKLNILC